MPNLSGASKTINSNRLAQFIANMPVDKVTRLCEILIDRTLSRVDFKNAYHDLYHQGESGFVQFQRFLRTHAIPEKLGGVNNLNYIISLRNPKTLKNTGLEPVILKVEAPSFQKVDMADKLRSDKLNVTLTPITASREVKGHTRDGARFTRNLIVTDFCDGGDLESYLKTIFDEEDKIHSIISIYLQMATILEIIKESDGFFSDMKNSNWLIKRKGEVLQIADTKGFLVAKEGISSEEAQLELGYCLVLLQTKYISPPEFFEDPYEFSVDKAHAFMLGKNIYQSLTGCHHEVLSRVTDASELAFTHPIFATDEGIKFKEIIHLLIKPIPEQRASVSSIMQKLISLKQDNDAKHTAHSSSEKDSNFEKRLDELLKFRQSAIQIQRQLKNSITGIKQAKIAELALGNETKNRSS